MLLGIVLAGSVRGSVRIYAKEKRKRVVVYEAYAADGRKVYDDSRNTELEIRAEWEGGKPDESRVELEVRGYAASEDVGVWRVDVEYRLNGPEAEDYVLECRKAALETRVEIVPKTLQVVISDAQKEYYTDADWKNLKFDRGERAIQVTGFMKNGEVSEQPPEGFQWPELKIDEKVLQKESPIYQDGRYLVYKNALTLQEQETAGGNVNYRYALQDTRYTKKGNITLTEAKADTEKNQIFAEKGNCVWNENEKCYEVSKGAVLCARPGKKSGYNQKIFSNALYGAGTWRFCMERRKKNGELQARSQMTEIKYKVQEEPPTAEVLLEGKKRAAYYTAESCMCSVNVSKGEKTGDIQVQWYLSEEKQETDKVKQKTGGWIDGSQMKIDQSGTWYPYVRLTDSFGNRTCIAAGKVVIDRKQPKIEIHGLPEHNIFTGTFQIQIALEEENRRKNKNRIRVYRITEKGEKEVFSEAYQENETIEKKLAQGWYQLEVCAEDLAGNRAEKQIRFSVNTSGPELTGSESMKAYFGKGAAKQGRSIGFQICDINEVQKEEIQCIRNGERKILQIGSDYQRVLSQKKDGKREYQYQIVAQTFQEEGAYALYIKLEDQAGYTLKKEQSVLCESFFIDRTPPICLIDPLEQEKGKFKVQLRCEDNTKFSKILLYKNDILQKEYRKPEERIEISFGQNEKWRLEIFDEPGNKEVRYLLKEELEQELKRKKLLPETEQKKKDGEENSTEEKLQKETNMQKKSAETESEKKQPFHEITEQQNIVQEHRKKGYIAWWILGSMMIVAVMVKLKK